MSSKAADLDTGGSMKWTKEKPIDEGWYWHRDSAAETSEVWRLRLDDDGNLVVGSDTTEDGIHRQPRRVNEGFLLYPNEQWSDEEIPEPIE